MSPFVWLGLALVLGIIELMSTTFILLWVAIAAVVTGILSFPMQAFAWQLALFVVLSVILLLATRPLVRRWRTPSKVTYLSNVQALEGETGIVVSRIAGGQAGLVRIDGQVWSARADDPALQLEKGEWVKVRSAKSAFLIVERSTGTASSAKR